MAWPGDCGGVCTCGTSAGFRISPIDHILTSSSELGIWESRARDPGVSTVVLPHAGRDHVAAHLIYAGNIVIRILRLHSQGVCGHACEDRTVYANTKCSTHASYMSVA